MIVPKPVAKTKSKFYSIFRQFEQDIYTNSIYFSFLPSFLFFFLFFFLLSSVFSLLLSYFFFPYLFLPCFFIFLFQPCFIFFLLLIAANNIEFYQYLIPCSLIGKTKSKFSFYFLLRQFVYDFYSSLKNGVKILLGGGVNLLVIDLKWPLAIDRLYLKLCFWSFKNKRVTRIFFFHNRITARILHRSKIYLAFVIWKLS